MRTARDHRYNVHSTSDATRGMPCRERGDTNAYRRREAPTRRNELCLPLQRNGAQGEAEKREVKAGHASPMGPGPAPIERACASAPL